MKKLLVLVMALLLVGSVSYSQDVVPNLTSGSKALIFQFGGLAVLAAGNFDGGFGAKYYLSPSMAVRAGLQFANANETISANPPAGSQGVDGTETATRIGIAAAVELHMGSGRVSPYIGAGVGFSTTSTEDKSLEIGNPPNPQTVVKNSAGGENIDGVNYQGGSSLTLYAIAGFEFFLWKEVSLAGEYRLGFASTGRKDQEVTAGSTTTTTKLGSSSTIGVASQGVLTLAVYL